MPVDFVTSSYMGFYMALRFIMQNYKQHSGCVSQGNTESPISKEYMTHISMHTTEKGAKNNCELKA